MLNAMNSENSEVIHHENKYESPVEKIGYTWKRFSDKIIWPYLIYLVFFHVGFIATLASYILGLHSVPIKKLTLLWTIVNTYLAVLGVTAGAHRLWSHRSYKAKRSLRILLVIFYSIAGQYSIRFWVKDHRQHHKYADTDLDPHNSRKGLFFSHYGWLFIKRTPECIRAGKEINIDDIRQDPVAMFQDKYGKTLVLLFCFIIPTAIPVIFWGETVTHAILTQFFIRYVWQLNITFTVNSIVHRWGYRPYNRSISATDNPIVSVLVGGEAAHNYHHTFPWDWKGTELPFVNFNYTTNFIRAMASLGLAYDLREPSLELVKKIKERNNYENVVSNGHTD